MLIVAAAIAVVLWFAYGWTAGCLGLLLAGMVFLATARQAFREADATIDRILHEELPTH